MFCLPPHLHTPRPGQATISAGYPLLWSWGWSGLESLFRFEWETQWAVTLAVVRRGSSHVLHYPGQHECVVLAQPAVRLEQSGVHCSSQGFTLLGRLIINPPLDTMSLVTKILADYDDCRLSLVVQLRMVRVHSGCMRNSSLNVLSLGSDGIALQPCLPTITTWLCSSSAASSPSGAIRVLQLSLLLCWMSHTDTRLVSDGSG